jgi:hypothetical protein
LSSLAFFLARVIWTRKEPFDGTLWITILQVLRGSVRRRRISERGQGKTAMSPHVQFGEELSLLAEERNPYPPTC